MILELDDVYLHEPCERINFVEDDIQTLDTQMKESLEHHKGLGLAANQVGIKKQVFAIQIGEEIFCVYNPKVLDTSPEMCYMDEGCLSYPNLILKIKRPEKARVRFANLQGEYTTEIVTGLTCRIFLHEIDHLNGIVFKNRANRFHLNKGRKRLKRIQNAAPQKT